jgi:hypothetical protein
MALASAETLKVTRYTLQDLRVAAANQIVNTFVGTARGSKFEINITWSDGSNEDFVWNGLAQASPKIPRGDLPTGTGVPLSACY